MGYDIKSTGSFANFKDSDNVSGWAVSTMKWAVENDIYTGVKNKLLPTEKASRVLVADMFFILSMSYNNI
jgi:hypothetical protein